MAEPTGNRSEDAGRVVRAQPPPSPALHAQPPALAETLPPAPAPGSPRTTGLPAASPARTPQLQLHEMLELPSHRALSLATPQHDLESPAGPPVWDPPSIERARKTQDTFHPRFYRADGSSVPFSCVGTATGRFCRPQTEGFDPFCEGSVSDLGRFGAGVSIFFKFSKWLVGTFVALALVQLGPLLVYSQVSSDSIALGDVSLASLAVTTLGNLARVRSNDTGNSEFFVVGLRDPVTVRDIAYFAGATEVLVFLVFGAAVAWLWVCEKEESYIVSRTVISAADFSIRIPWVPSTTTSEELGAYIQQRVGVTPFRVWLAYDYGPIYRVANARRHLLDRLEVLDDRLGRIYTKFGQRFRAQVRFDSRSFHAMNEALQSPSFSGSFGHGSPLPARSPATPQLRSRPAFFADPSPEQSAAHRVRAGPPVVVRFDEASLDPAKGRSGGASDARVAAPPVLPPSSTDAAGVVDAVPPRPPKSPNAPSLSSPSLLPPPPPPPPPPPLSRSASAARSPSRSALRPGPPEPPLVSKADLVLVPAIAREEFQRLPPRQQQLALLLWKDRAQLLEESARLQRSVLEVRFLGGAQHAFVTFQDRAHVRRALKVFGRPWYAQLWRHAREPDALRFRGSFVLDADPAPLPSTILWHNLAHDWRSQWLRQLVTALLATVALAVSAGVLFATKRFERDGVEAFGASASVETHDGSSSSSTYSVLLSAAVVNATNAVLNRIGRLMASFEKHHSVTEMEASIVKRLLLRQVINTGVLLVVVNMSGNVLPAALSGVWPAEGYTDLSPAWFRNVGTLVLATMLMNIFVPWIGPFGRLVIRLSQQRLHRWGCRTLHSQRQLDRLFLGPPMDISDRYSRLMMTLVVCFVLSPGLPLLSVLGAASFVVSYALDKWFFVAVYRTPPFYDDRIHRVASSLLAWAFMARLLVSIWVLSSSTLDTGTSPDVDDFLTALVPDTPVSEIPGRALLRRVLQPHVLGVLVLFLGITIVFTLWLVWNGYLSLAGRFCPQRITVEDREMQRPNQRFFHRRVVPVDGPRQQHLDVFDNAPYEQLAAAGDILSDLPSYDVRENPQYRDALLVTRVRRQGDEDEEDEDDENEGEDEDDVDGEKARASHRSRYNLIEASLGVSTSSIGPPAPAP